MLSKKESVSVHSMVDEGFLICSLHCQNFQEYQQLTIPKEEGISGFTNSTDIKNPGKPCFFFFFCLWIAIDWLFK